MGVFTCSVPESLPRIETGWWSSFFCVGRIVPWCEHGLEIIDEFLFYVGLINWLVPAIPRGKEVVKPIRTDILKEEKNSSESISQRDQYHSSTSGSAKKAMCSHDFNQEPENIATITKCEDKRILAEVELWLLYSSPHLSNERAWKWIEATFRQI